MERPVFSDMLLVRRRELGYSIRQASRVLRLREDVLTAFEEGNFEQMPKSGYAQGMLSSYARYLGLDAGEVVRAFTRDLDRYNREMRHHRREADRHIVGISGGRPTGENVGQPYVRSRGLLPTSGGKAGDLGSFSTTRVRPRGFGDSDRDADDDYVGENLAHTGYEVEFQTRPYTARTPRVTSRTSSSSWDATQIRTQPVGMFDYNDDLRLGNDAQRFESASTDVGRRSSRHISDASRPRIQRRGEDPRGRTSDRGRGRTGSRGGMGGLPFAGGNVLVIGAIVAVVVITVVIVLSVSSCVSQGTEGRTVPVSAAIEAEQNNEAGQADNAPAQDANATAEQPAPEQPQPADPAAGTAAMSNTGVTSVSVSVADGAVTWLEVTCDGVSDVAATVTGPWQRTYTVWESLTVHANDTTAVSVVQNGSQVQFDSIASGIGTLRVEGPGKPKEDKTSKDDGKASEGETTGAEGQQSQNHIGNQTATATEGESADAGAADAGGSEGEGSYGYEDSGYDDSGYGYDDSGYGYDDSGYGYDDGSDYEDYGYY